MSADALALIKEHLSSLEALALSEEPDLPDPPDLSRLAIAPDDLERARELLDELRAVEKRLAGMRVRVRGEIEGVRRSWPEPPAPEPRVLDTSA